jgi:hypothetical protein
MVGRPGERDKAAGIVELTGGDCAIRPPDVSVGNSHTAEGIVTLTSVDDREVTDGGIVSIMKPSEYTSFAARRQRMIASS